MILHTLELENWKLFRQPLSLSFGPGLNLLLGPNEAGKSTLISAIRLLLVLSHTSKSATVQQLVPWGTSLAPRGAVELESRGKLWRLEKTFLQQPTARLYQQKKGEWILIAEGDRAEKQILELIGAGERARGRKGLSAKNLGLLQDLWRLQGEELPKGLSPKGQSLLSQKLQQIQSTPQEERIRKALEQQLDRLLTKSQRKPKKNSPLAKVIEERQKWEERYVALEEELRSREHLARELGEKSRALQAVSREKAQLAQQREELEKGYHQWQEWQKELEKVTAKREDLQRPLELLQKDLQSWREYERQYRQCEEQLQIYEEEQKAQQDLWEKAQKEWEELERQYDQWQKEAKRARQARRREELEKRQKELEERQKWRRQKEKELQELERQLKELQVPSSDQWQALQKLEQQLRTLRAQQEVMGFEVHFHWHTPQHWQVRRDGGEGEHFTGQQAQTEALYRLEIELDQGTIQVLSRSEDAQKLQRDLAHLEDQWRQACHQWSITSLEELQKRREVAQKLAHKRESLAEQLATVPSHLEAELEACQKELAELPPATDVPPHEKERHWQAEEDQWQSRKDEAKKKLKGLEKQVREVEQKVLQLRAERESLEKRLHEFRKRHQSLEALEKEVTQREEEWRQWQSRYEELCRQKEEREKQRLAWQQWQKRWEEVQERYHQTERKVIQLQSALEASGVGQDALQEARDKVAFYQRQEEELWREARALELLLHLWDSLEAEFERGLRPALEGHLRAYLERVIGPHYRVELSPECGLATIAVPDWDLSVPPEALSFGTQEQLNLAFRLALGTCLADGERQLVVLDDPLANADGERRRRAVELLEELSETLQILLVSCRPEEYEDLFSQCEKIYLQGGKVV